jgi:hypothetical protein
MRFAPALCHIYFYSILNMDTGTSYTGSKHGLRNTIYLHIEHRSVIYIRDSSYKPCYSVFEFLHLMYRPCFFSFFFSFSNQRKKEYASRRMSATSQKMRQRERRTGFKVKLIDFGNVREIGFQVSIFRFDSEEATHKDYGCPTKRLNRARSLGLYQLSVRLTVTVSLTVEL